MCHRMIKWKGFGELELPQIEHMAPEEKAYERFFKETTELVNKRFVVSLLFKKSVTLSDSLD